MNFDKRLVEIGVRMKKIWWLKVRRAKERKNKNSSFAAAASARREEQRNEAIWLIESSTRIYQIALFNFIIQRFQTNEFKSDYLNKIKYYQPGVLSLKVPKDEIYLF